MRAAMVVVVVVGMVMAYGSGLCGRDALPGRRRLRDAGGRAAGSHQQQRRGRSQPHRDAVHCGVAAMGES
jgi:hypothetical protein